MDEIVWSGWLQKKGGDATGMVNRLTFMGISTNKERYFVLNRSSITYYAPPSQVSRGSLFIQSPTHKALTELGFSKKGSVDLVEILSFKKTDGDHSIQLITDSGRTYEFSCFEDSASALDLTAFESCLQSLGVKMEDQDMSAIYKEADDAFQGGARLLSPNKTVSFNKLANAMPDNPMPTSPTVASLAAAAATAAAASTETTTAATTSATPAPVVTPPPILTGKDILKRPAHLQSSDDHMSDLVSNREKTIDEMKIQTMYKMVEDVEVSAEGRNLEKKVLYLTNKQCNMFDDVGILRCLQALDLGKPKCVIRLLSAEKGVAQYTVHTESRGFIWSPQQFGCELGAHDASRLNMQIDLFMKTCILPLAKQTHALIICSGCNDDALAASLERVVVPEQVRLGKNCPFKVLTFVWSFEVHYKAYMNEGIAGKVASECCGWGLRLDALTQFMADYQDKNLQRADMIQSSSHVIVFETFEDGKAQMGPSKAFQAKLMDAMTTQLPSIAIQVSACDYGVTSDLSRRGIPILFLDGRERAITTRPNHSNVARELITQMAERSNAFPIILASHMAKFPKHPDGTITMAAKRELLHLAFHMVESTINALAEQDLVDYDNTSAVALIHSALKFGIDGTDSDSSYVPLYARLAELRRAEQDSGSATGTARSHIPLELAKEAAHYINARMRTVWAKARLRHVNKWLVDNPVGSKMDLNQNRALAQRWQTYIANNVKFADSNGGEYQTEQDPVIFLNILDVLTSPLTFSGSLFDLEEVSRTISSVVKIDRLPKHNSMEALLSLQDAWDHVDAYHRLADFYKVVTKLSYGLLLLAGLATSVIAIIREDVDDSSGEGGGNTPSQWIILGLSLLVTTVVGYVNFMNPAQRWQQLRGAAMNMESQIWLFRTRSGDYRRAVDSDSDSSDADALLQEQIQTIKNAVLEGADIKGTSFFGNFGSPNLHAQHPPSYRQIQESKSRSFVRGSCQSSEGVASEAHKPQHAAHGSTGGAIAGGPGGAGVGPAMGGPSYTQLSSPPLSPQFPPLLRSPMEAAAAAAAGGATEDAARRGPVSAEDLAAELSLSAELQADSLHLPSLPFTAQGSTTIDELLVWLGTRFVSNTGNAMGPKDSHYLPVLPNNYVQFRIEKALKFYKKRIPLCNRTRHIGQLLSTVGSLASVVLAFLNMLEYTVLTAIGTTGVMAWLEFQGTNNKIERYSSVVDALQKHIIWWKTRPPIEKSATENIDRLVVTCEEIIRDEMNAWRSSSASQAKLLEKQVSDNSGGGGGEA